MAYNKKKQQQQQQQQQQKTLLCPAPQKRVLFKIKEHLV